MRSSPQLTAQHLTRSTPPPPPPSPPALRKPLRPTAASPPACIPSCSPAMMARLPAACRRSSSPTQHPKLFSNSLPSTRTRTRPGSTHGRSPLCITAYTLTAVLGRVRRGAAPGLTGWTYEHMLDATPRPSARRVCLEFLNEILAGCLPTISDLLVSDALPLRITNGVISPIAIGEAWLRLAALCTVHEYSRLGPSLTPL
jgi:hypothetical protein